MAAFRRTKSDLSLIREGKAVLELLVEKDPSALDALDLYITSFSDWQTSWKERIAAAPTEKELRALGGEVAKQHSEVLRLAGEMKDSIGTALRSLRRKGKGLIAYADHLPKRISTIRPRKG